MDPVPTITEADLERARSDPAFRQKFLGRNLELLLDRMQQIHRDAPNDPASKQLREGVELALRLAEMIQSQK